MTGKGQKAIILGVHHVEGNIIKHYNVLQKDVAHHKGLTLEGIDINDFDEICLLSGKEDDNRAIALFTDLSAAYDMYGMRLLCHLLVQKVETSRVLKTCDLCDAVRMKLDVYPFNLNLKDD